MNSLGTGGYYAKKGLLGVQYDSLVQMLTSIIYTIFVLASSCHYIAVCNWFAEKTITFNSKHMNDIAKTIHDFCKKSPAASAGTSS